MSKQDEIQARLEGKLHEFNSDIEALKAKAKNKEGDARAAFNEQVSKLETKREALRGKLDEIKHSSSDASQIVKDGAERAWDDMANALKAAKNQFG